MRHEILLLLAASSRIMHASQSQSPLLRDLLADVNVDMKFPELQHPSTAPTSSVPTQSPINNPTKAPTARPTVHPSARQTSMPTATIHEQSRPPTYSPTTVSRPIAISPTILQVGNDDDAASISSSIISSISPSAAAQTITMAPSVEPFISNKYVATITLVFPDRAMHLMDTETISQVQTTCVAFLNSQFDAALGDNTSRTTVVTVHQCIVRDQYVQYGDAGDIDHDNNRPHLVMELEVHGSMVTSADNSADGSSSSSRSPMTFQDLTLTAFNVQSDSFYKELTDESEFFQLQKAPSDLGDEEADGDSNISHWHQFFQDFANGAILFYSDLSVLGKVFVLLGIVLSICIMVGVIWVKCILPKQHDENGRHFWEENEDYEGCWARVRRNNYNNHNSRKVRSSLAKNRRGNRKKNSKYQSRGRKSRKANGVRYDDDNYDDDYDDGDDFHYQTEGCDGTRENWMDALTDMFFPESFSYEDNNDDSRYGGDVISVYSDGTGVEAAPRYVGRRGRDYRY